MNFKTLLVAGLLTIAAPISAMAASLIEDGDSVDITSSGGQFFGEIDAGAGGAGEWNVEFFTTEDPLEGLASATIGNIVSNQFTDLIMSWIAADGVTVLDSVDVVPLMVALETTFTAPNLTQTLNFSWTASTAGAGFDVEVSSVPVPAGILLMGTALAGFGVMRRRKQQTA